MNNHVQINPAHKRPGLTQSTPTGVSFHDADCRRWKVVMPQPAWLAIAGILLVAAPLGAAEVKEQAAAPVRKQAVKQGMRAQTAAFAEGRYLLVDLSEDANDTFAKTIGKAPLNAGPVPFRLPQGDKDHLSLREAQWNGWVPTTFAFTQDIDTSTPLEIEVTKEVRLARRNPDPNRYRYRPLGLPSGVRIAAVTLEKSPLQMRVTSGESGHAFVEPQVPTFKVSLTNITPAAQAYTLALQAIHLGGSKVQAQ